MGSLISELAPLGDLEARERADELYKQAPDLAKLDPPTFTTVLSKLSKRSSGRLVHDVLEAARAAGALIGTIHWNVAVGAFATEGSWREACSLLDVMEHHSARRDSLTYHEAMKVCAQTGQWEAVVDLLSDARVRDVELDSGSALFAVGARAPSEWTEALQLLEEMAGSSAPVDDFACSVAAHACAEGGQWERAVHLLGRSMPCTYHSLVNACSRGGEWTQTLQLLSDMKERNMRMGLGTYSATMCSFEKSGQWPLAWHMLKTMKKRKVYPATNSFNSAISACRPEGEWRRAFLMMGKMTDQKVARDTVTYNAVLSVCEKSGQLQRASDLLNEMVRNQVEMDAFTFESAIRLYGQAGIWEQALAQLQVMATRGIPPVQNNYMAAVVACADCAAWTQALQLLEDLSAGGLDPGAPLCNTAMSACARAGEWLQALKLFDAMPSLRADVDTVSYNAAINAVEKCGEWVKALELVDSMASRGLKADTTTYNTAVSACGKSGEWEMALHLLDEMKDAKVELDSATFASAIFACATTGEISQALRLKDAMEEQGVSANVDAYIAAATACGKSGNWEQAFQLMDEMKRRKVEMDASVLTNSLKSCVEDNQWRRALSLLDGIAEKAGRAQATKELCQMLRNMYWRGHVTDSVLRAAMNWVRDLYSVPERELKLPPELFGTTDSKMPAILAEQAGLCALWKPRGWAVSVSDAALAGEAEEDNGGEDDDDMGADVLSPPTGQGRQIQTWLANSLGRTFRIANDRRSGHGTVHRLDRHTSGILLWAKNHTAHRLAKVCFASCRVLKEYVCLVEGHIDAEARLLEAPLEVVKDPSGSWARSRVSSEGEPASTRLVQAAHFLGPDGRALSLVELRLHTGKTHQIRVHLQNEGYPLLGDYLYGEGDSPSWCRDFLLHCFAVGIDIGDGPFKVEAPMPASFRKVLTEFRPIDAKAEKMLEKWLRGRPALTHASPEQLPERVTVER